MWTKFDSRSATGHWMSWDMANEWVIGLSTGGHRDWQMPTIAELKTLYDPQYSVLANGNDANFPMHFCLLFNSGGAWTYWSSENIAKAEFWTLNLNNGYDYAVDGNDESINVGVRAVRNIK
ncbi:MAG: DUF1566 domain-containing protein [Deltaproteobacteria bacterium]|nr:DUF1566 domain-containing protein [Deltaproteobacteria bacterium]